MDKNTAYQDTATMAAKLEKSGDYGQAASFWRMAQDLAKCVANEFWCQTRAERCERLRK
ncbi:ANR family transcriptional regulator [Serratia marcescens]|uniref:ANR family transcriptional regulator n=1 Tax=Serratia marcescens TaxID=615 RepID=UPI00124A3080|nr:ANR family transcriptional regulator [Serratia marcescens]KAB1579668.1 ANR family transcriptional regulator [Serratia marcescens]